MIVTNNNRTKQQENSSLILYFKIPGIQNMCAFNIPQVSQYQLEQPFPTPIAKDTSF